MPRALSLERKAQALAVLCLAILAVMAGRPSFTNASQPGNGVHDPKIALQMARDARDVDDILEDAPSPDREVMRLKQYIDFAFIGGYVALFWIMSQVLARRSRWGYALALCGIAVAVPNVIENLEILRLIPLDLRDTPQALIDSIRHASVAKWSAASIAMVILGMFFLDAKRWTLRLMGAADVLSGAAACWGLVNHPVLAWAGGCMAAGLLLSAATLKFVTYESAS
jgi:hypothetical protein